jgi:hypothetical protein
MAKRIAPAIFEWRNTLRCFALGAVNVTHRAAPLVIASLSEAIHGAAKQKNGLLRRKCSSQ